MPPALQPETRRVHGFGRMGALSPMAEIPHETPGAPGPGRSTGTDGTAQPAVKGAESGRSGQVGPEDADAGPEGALPDPDEYADPGTQGTHPPQGGERP